MFEKKNVFIAGYNDTEVHPGDAGYVRSSIEELKKALARFGTSGGVTIESVNSDKGFTLGNGITDTMFYRTSCAPKVTVKPWTEDTVPADLMGTVLTNKCWPNCHGMVTWTEGGSVILGKETFEYSELLADWLMPDGSPCGQEVTE